MHIIKNTTKTQLLIVDRSGLPLFGLVDSKEKTNKPKDGKSPYIGFVDIRGELIVKNMTEKEALKTIERNPYHLEYIPKTMFNKNFLMKLVNTSPRIFWLSDFPQQSRNNVNILLKAMDSEIHEGIFDLLPPSIQEDPRVIRKYLLSNYLGAVKKYFLRDKKVDNYHMCLITTHREDFTKNKAIVTIAEYLKLADKDFLDELLLNGKLQKSIIDDRHLWAETLDKMAYSNVNNEEQSRFCGLDILLLKMDNKQLKEIVYVLKKISIRKSDTLYNLAKSILKNGIAKI